MLSHKKNLARHLCLLCLFLLLGLISWGRTLNPDSQPVIYNCPFRFTQALSDNVHTIRIPFKVVGRLIAVQAKADTVEGTFIIDTGAERLLLNKRYFYGGAKVTSRSVYGASGKVGGVKTKVLDSLQWDSWSLERPQAHLVDLSHIEAKRKSRIVGIIGYELLKDYEVLIDYPFKQIVLTRLDNKGFRLDKQAFLNEPMDSMDFNLSRHGIILEGSVLGTPLKFNLDTGAEINLIDRQVHKKVLRNFKIVRRVKMMGAGQKEIEVLAGLLSGVQCGPQPNTSMRTLLTNLDDLSRLYGTKIQGVLGFEFLRPKRTIINYKRKKLYFLNLVRP